ncbi:MAG: phage tail tape measure protein, partial [Candidatus Ornithomonoglobus sp.]
YATMIAGKNAMSGFLSIVNSSPADFQALTDAINNSEGAAQTMADTMNDTVSGKLTLLKSQFEGVKIAIFDALGSSQFKGVLQSMSDGLTAITPYVTAFTVAIGNGLFAAIQGIYNIASTVFNAVKTTIENNGPAIEGVRSAFDNVKTSIVNAFSGNGTALIQTLADVILPTLCNSLSMVMNIASGVITAASTLSPVIAGIAAAVTAYKVSVAAANAVESIRNGLIAFSAVMTGTQAAAFAPLTTATIAQIAATSALNVVTGTFGAIMTFVTSPIGIVVIAIGALIAIGVLLWKNWDSVCAWCKSAFQSVSDFFVSVGTGIASFFTGLWSGISNTVSSVWSGITGFLSGAWNAISSAATSVFTGIATAISNVWNGIVNTIKGAINGIISGINSMIRGAVSGINGLINGINKVTGVVGIPAIPTFTAPQIPLLAKGGNIQTAGAVIVGENGPEMLELPKGARVTPLSKTADAAKPQHFSIRGVFSLNQPSALSFGVELYRKGGIMTRPTIFGMNATNAMVGGEAGAEAILPLTQFWNNLREYLKPQSPQSVPVNKSYYITVNVDGGSADDDALANKMAKRIVEVIENM